MNISHSRVSDLHLFLVAPDGTRVELANRVGGNGSNYNNTLFDDDAATLITTGTAPFSGTFRPSGDLKQVEGKPVTGTWTLEVVDERNGTGGTLNSWSLEVTRIVSTPPPAVASLNTSPVAQADAVNAAFEAAHDDRCPGQR